MKQEIRQFVLLVGFVLSVVIIRVLAIPFWGEPISFSPVNALALFCGAYFSQKKYLPFVITLVAVWFSDIFIDRIYLHQWTLFYAGFYWQYLSIMFITLIGLLLQNRINVLNVAAAGFGSAILFFIISNFGCWAMGWYPASFAGLIACYVAAIPFFKYALVGNLIYCPLFFGGFEILQAKMVCHKLRTSL